MHKTRSHNELSTENRNQKNETNTENLSKTGRLHAFDAPYGMTVQEFHKLPVAGNRDVRLKKSS